MKANLDYVIRSVTAPGESEPSLVPVIVNRIPSRPISADAPPRSSPPSPRRSAAQTRGEG